MPVSESTFKKLALEDPEGHWELVIGRPRQKPGMTVEHNDVALMLAHWLLDQLDRGQFRVRCNAGHVRRSADSYFIPDVMVVPADQERAQRATGRLECYVAPLPLVVEVWSPSTGAYDIEIKLSEYQRRGDVEIWRVHPFDRVLTAWVRQSDGTYPQSTNVGGTITAAALPGASIDLDALFALA
jgi:Uma2 family endonuclease